MTREEMPVQDHADTVEDLDVAIVGGGVSGLYAGWRLLSQAKERGEGAPRLAVFDCSDRTGGRLLSATPPGVPGTRVELGGMRFTSSHPRVCALVKHFNLAKNPFPVGQPENIAYLRGKLLRTQDLVDPSLIPYTLAPDERSPEVLGEGFTAVVAQRVLRTMLKKDYPLAGVDWDEVAREGRYDGKPLSELPLEYVMRRNISQEAFRFAQDTSGYDSILHTWNAADGFPWNLADFGHHVDFFHLHDGFEKLPDCLRQRVETGGGAIRPEKELRRFDVATLPDGSRGVALWFKGDPVEAPSVRARRLILAMPRRSLELLDPSGPVLAAKNEHVRRLIASVEPIPLFKLALCYSYPWWRTIEPALVDAAAGDPKPARITKGQSITDIPLRQCYYWATDEDTQNSVLLIYDDGTDLDFWAALRDPDKDRFVPDASAPDGGSGSKNWDDNAAPDLMVQEAHRQLCIMHGVTDRLDIPKPYAAAYRDWGADPFGGGANFWRVDVESHAVFEAILQPEPDVPVYVCGEAYSHYQGWVEGALETADAMLKRHFGIDPPAWTSGGGEPD